MLNNYYKSKHNNYCTPEEIYSAILKFTNNIKFNIDVCCNNTNIPAHRHIMSKGLEESWNGICFMNPPFNEINKWLKKAFNEVNRTKDDIIKCDVWCIMPGNRMNTKYMQSLLNSHSNWFIAALDGRFNFIVPDCEDETNINRNNGGLNTQIFILYIGNKKQLYLYQWNINSPIKSILLSRP